MNNATSGSFSECSNFEYTLKPSATAVTYANQQIILNFYIQFYAMLFLQIPCQLSAFLSELNMLFHYKYLFFYFI